MTGRIFSIEEFAIYDGPGIRSSVFMKGCPLRCSWCHNPEGQRYSSEIVKSPNGCIGCGNCIKTAIQKNGETLFSERSISACPKKLLRVCGEEYESQKLCEKLLKNKRILQKGGGVTFSGGEPLLQYEFVFECIRKLKGELHTAIQTSGYCDIEVFNKALSLTDYFLFDLKLIDDEAHRRFTGASNAKILKNFALLANSKNDFVIRVPLIPTVTDTEDNLIAIASLLHDSGISYVELLPYNKMAGGKYTLVGRRYDPGFDETVECSPHPEIFSSYGIECKIM